MCSECTKDGSSPDPRWCLRHKWREEHVARIPHGVESKVAKLDVAVCDTVRCSCGESFAVDTGRLQQVVVRGKDLLEADGRGEYGTYLCMELANVDASNADIDTALMRLQTCVATLLQTCPASTYPVVSLSRLIVRLLTVRPINTIKALAPVLKHLLDAQTGAEAIYTPHHPTLAVLAAQKARLLGVELVEEDRVQHVQLLLKRGVTPQDVMVLQGMGIVGEASRLRAAVEAYREAIKRCQGCFGPKGGVLAAKLEREMQVVQMEMAASGRAMLS